MIHPTAIIHPGARLGRNIRIGPYAVVDAAVVIDDGCRIGPHAVVEGSVTIGADTEIGPHAVIGAPPQDLGYRGEPTRLVIGERNIIREFVTMHRASTKERGVTRVGDDGFFMAYCHIGHDCKIGNHVVMANAATLAGHVVVQDHVNIAGLCAIHQFARIGEYAMLGGGTMAPMDIPPFVMASGNHARLYGINRRGLQRHGFGQETIRQIRQAYRILFQSGLRLEEALQRVAEDSALQDPTVARLVAFIRSSRRGITR